jgi:hypothetical protein
MKVWRLQLEHLMNAVAANAIRSLLQLLGSIISSSKCSVDETLTMLDQQVVSLNVSARRNLDQLGKTIANLRNRQSSQKRKVKERVNWAMISTEAVLVVAVVDGDFDRYGCINQTDDGCGNTNVVGVATVSGACKAVKVRSWSTLLRVEGRHIPSHISHQASSDNENWLLSDDTKLGHGVDNAQHCVHGFGLLSNHGLVDLESNAVMVKVVLQLLAIEVEDVKVHDG